MIEDNSKKDPIVNNRTDTQIEKDFVLLAPEPITDDSVDIEITYRHKGETRIGSFEVAPSIQEGINLVTEAGWEEDSATLKQELYILRYQKTQQIAAVGIYQPGTSSLYKDRPDLLWINADGIITRRQCHY